MDASSSVEEVLANLGTYRQQLQDVETLLKSDPKNAEYLEAKQGLEEIIKLTEELLQSMPQGRAAPSGERPLSAHSALRILWGTGAAHWHREPPRAHSSVC